MAEMDDQAKNEEATAKLQAAINQVCLVAPFAFGEAVSSGELCSFSASTGGLLPLALDVRYCTTCNAAERYFCGESYRWGHSAVVAQFDLNSVSSYEDRNHEFFCSDLFSASLSDVEFHSRYI